jgi:hypothetical protein
MARNAFRGGDTRGLIPCKPSAACRTQFIREFGLKAYRRPLEAEEQKRYEALMRKETDFYKGAQLAVEAMLQSPPFLFRLEGSSNPAWKQYAAASPPLLRALGQHARRRTVRIGREGGTVKSPGCGTRGTPHVGPHQGARRLR